MEAMPINYLTFDERMVFDETRLMIDTAKAQHNLELLVYCESVLDMLMRIALERITQAAVYMD